jgi:hypothetical protein
MKSYSYKKELKGVLLGNTYNRLPPEQLEVASDSEISFIETKYEKLWS